MGMLGYPLRILIKISVSLCGYLGLMQGMNSVTLKRKTQVWDRIGLGFYIVSIFGCCSIVLAWGLKFANNNLFITVNL